MATKPNYAATYVSDDYEISTSPKGKKNTIEGAMMSETPNAGRGKQGGPTAKQADQNRAFMSDAEKAARDSAAEMKMQERTNKAFEDASKGMKKGGKVSSASSRADGCCIKGKTRGKMV